MKKVAERKVDYIVKERKQEREDETDQPRPLRRGIVKEEYYVLTKDPIIAAILSQFFYWTQRTGDYDKFVKEENIRLSQEGEKEIQPTRGWIYKTSEEMADEVMLAGESTIRRGIIMLVKNQYLSERNNPHHRWDRTLQYRVNVLKVATDLYRLGYQLPEELKIDPSILHDAVSKMQDESSKPTGESSKMQGDAALPYSTSQSTLDTSTKSSGGDKDQSPHPPVESPTPPPEPLGEHNGMFVDDGRLPVHCSFCGGLVNWGDTSHKCKTTHGEHIYIIPQIAGGSQLADHLDPAKVRLPASIRNGSEKKATKHDKVDLKLAHALADVCGIPYEINTPQINAETKRLMKGTPTPTAELVYEKFEKGGWWYLTDWRGKKGQAPSTKAVRESWGKWESEDVPRVRSSGRNLGI